MMRSRRAFLLVAAIAIGIATLYLFPFRRLVSPPVSTSATSSAGATPTSPSAAASPAVAPQRADGPSELANELNAPSSSIRRDLEIASELFAAWQASFPGDGNPVGENGEITAALAGQNRHEFAFIPKNHRAINARGELCDRWGTPFRFHQVSGTHMEIRSAGPDRKFATPDDAQWPPE